MEKIENIIATNLLYLRKKSGLTQLEFGEKFNYSDKTVSKWEQGMVVPSVETLKEIADFYGVSVDFIISEHSNKKDFESTIKKTANARNKIIIMLLTSVFVLCIAVTIYVSSILNLGTADPEKNRWWCTFLWMLPVAFTIAAFQTYRYFRNLRNIIILLSFAVWTLLISAYVTFLYINNYWYLFIIGIPIQAALILITQLGKNK